MSIQPERRLDNAIYLINELHKSEYDNETVKLMAKKANNEAWLSYKANPNDIDSIAVFAITEGAIGNIKRSIKLFEDEVINKIDMTRLDKDTLILIFINYAEALMVDKQFNKALNAVESIKDLLDLENNKNSVNELVNIYIFQTIFRIYFEHDLYSEIIQLSDITEQICFDDSKLAPKVSKMLVHYTLKNYNQLIICFNEFAESIKLTNIETIFETMKHFIISGSAQLSYDLTSKEKNTLDNIKDFIYNYIENNKLEGINNMFEEYDETIPDELQQQFTYTLDELLEGFNGSNHDEIPTGEPIGNEVW